MRLPLVTVWYTGAAVMWCPVVMHAQSAQKAAEIACVQEIRQQGASLWSTRTVKQEGGQTLSYRRLETVDGEVQQLIAVNGHSPDGPEKAKNDELLHTLLMDSAARKKAADLAHHDADRLRDLLSVIPAMFVFREKANDGTTRVLSFGPNPLYKPRTYEERAIHSLVGEVRLDARTARLEVLEAHVSETVRFGYGILGSLSQGGTVYVRFTEVAPGIWKTQEAKLNIEGHIALVKNLSKTGMTTRSDFQRLPSDFSILQALQTLGITR